MATYDWPTDERLIPARADLQSFVNTRNNVSAENGVSQAVTRPGSRWGWSVTLPAMANAAHATAEAMIHRLSAYEHRLRVYDWKRPRPRGTCNLNGVTLQSTVAQFDTNATLTGCGAGGTLLAGDWLAFANGQLVMNMADTTANGSGVMTIEFRWAARAQVNAGTTVTLDKPTALYVLATPNLSIPRGPGRAQPGFGFDLVEVFS